MKSDHGEVVEEVIVGDDEEKEDLVLPGFRFHPTDEELVTFYLRRKVAGKRLSIEIIKEMDIYKHEPWDFPKASTAGGEKELYFFCLRGRKYRNSIRPNRVTGSGFWKATGIDRPIYSAGDCIGLKKSLVYYRGSAGKGTKTDWMMHEFRLPPPPENAVDSSPPSLQEAEVWTICRIFKRNITYKKQPQQVAVAAVAQPDSSSITGSLESDCTGDEYMNFLPQAPVNNVNNGYNQQFQGQWNRVPQPSPAMAAFHQSVLSPAMPNRDILSGSVSESSKKRRGRAPAVLMEPRKEGDRPVLTPNGIDNWNVHPPCPKVATTLSLLIKQNYPGTYVSVDTNGKPCELVVYHWHQCPSDVRATALDEFLKRYKWSPGQEEECQKIFDRKAVKQLVNLFCFEKQRVREELAAKKAKKSSAVGRASGEMALEEEDGREDSEEKQGDESMVLLEHDDPLKWKPFVPEWMQPKWWEMLCDHWAKDEVMKVSYRKRKNRNAGNHPCNAAGSGSISRHQQLMRMDNGRKLVSDIDPSTKIHSGKGKLVGKKALRTEDTTYRHTEEARDTQLGPHPVQEQAGSWKCGRYYGAPGASKKAQIDSLSKSSPGCFSKQEQQPMFTQEQVQQMINQALQGLNETWEKKFMSLEQNMRSISSSHVVPVGAKGSLVIVAGDKQCQLARQDTLDSVDGEKDEGENQDEDEHWS